MKTAQQDKKLYNNNGVHKNYKTTFPLQYPQSQTTHTQTIPNTIYIHNPKSETTMQCEDQVILISLKKLLIIYWEASCNKGQKMGYWKGRRFQKRWQLFQLTAFIDSINWIGITINKF